MSKFIKNVLVFGAPIIVFFVIIEILIQRIPNDYSYKKSYLDQHSNEIEAFFLGSSHAFYSINPKNIHFNSFNGAHIAQSLDYDLEILRKYEKQTDKLKYIVVPIDYFSLFNRLETGVESWRIKNYNIYYGFNKSYQYKDNFEILNGKLFDNIKRVVHFYWHHKSEVSCNSLGWGTKHNSKNNKDLISTGKAAAKRHAKKRKSFFNENLAIVKEIIAIAKFKKAKVIFYTNPGYKTYVSQLNKEQLKITYTTIKRIANSNPNVTYYDFLSDPSFMKEDFFDADHLNEIGAEKFSKKMDSIIISLKQ